MYVLRSHERAEQAINGGHLVRQGGEAARRGMARQLLEARVYQKRVRGCDAWTRRFENGMNIFHLPNPPT